MTVAAAHATLRRPLSRRAHMDVKQDGKRFGTPVVLLLATAILANYVDRGNLATSAPLLRSDLHLDNSEYGWLVSAFFWVYVPGQLFAAWLIQRLNAYRTLSIGLAVWSAATLASGFADSFATLLALRVVLGVGESAGFPASSKLLAENLPAERLGRANGLVSAGIFLGPAVGTFLGGLIVAHAGWRALFIGFGAASFLWLLPWRTHTRALSAASRAALQPEPSFRELLKKRQLWGASIGHFCVNYPLYMVLSWLPLYLVKSQGFSLTVMAQLGGLVYGLATLTCVGGGWIADRWIANGASVSRVRMAMICAVGVVWFACMLCCGLGGARLAIAGLIASSVAMGLGGLNLYVIAQTLAGPRAAGKWMGVQNAVGNLAGILAPIVTGALLDRTGSYSVGFLLAGFVSLLGAASWLILVRRVAAVGWQPGHAGRTPGLTAA